MGWKLAVRSLTVSLGRIYTNDNIPKTWIIPKHPICALCLLPREMLLSVFYWNRLASSTFSNRVVFFYFGSVASEIRTLCGVSALSFYHGP